MYEEITEVRLALFSIIDTREREQSIIKAKKESYTKLCLDAFVTGIRGPLGAFVRALRPKTLSEAYEEALKEGELYFQDKKRKMLETNNPRQGKRGSNESQGQNAGTSYSNNGNNGSNYNSNNNRFRVIKTLTIVPDPTVRIEITELTPRL